MSPQTTAEAVERNREQCRAYYKEHRDEIRAKQNARRNENRTDDNARLRERYQSDSDYRNRIRGYQRAYYDTHRQTIIERVREWCDVNPERRREIARAWDRRNLASRRIVGARRRRLMEANGPIEDFTVEDVYARGFGLCGICGDAVSDDFHIDHIIPISRGGTHTIDNVQLSHPLCNLRKGAR